MSLEKSRFKILFAIGSVILIIGLVVYWYPMSVIDGLEQNLKEPGLSLDERNKFEGALGSWKILQITIFSLTSSILFAVGIIIIVYSVISGAFSIAFSHKIVKKGKGES